MFYVYILRSMKYPDVTYVGYTTDLKQRLFAHNNLKKCYYTFQYQPWNLEVYLGFKDRNKAIKFEKYLKTGSGRTFLKRHF